MQPPHPRCCHGGAPLVEAGGCQLVELTGKGRAVRSGLTFSTPLLLSSPASSSLPSPRLAFSLLPVRTPQARALLFSYHNPRWVGFAVGGRGSVSSRWLRGETDNDRGGTPCSPACLLACSLLPPFVHHPLSRILLAHTSASSGERETTRETNTHSFNRSAQATLPPPLLFHPHHSTHPAPPRWPKNKS